MSPIAEVRRNSLMMLAATATSLLVATKAGKTRVVVASAQDIAFCQHTV